MNMSRLLLSLFVFYLPVGWAQQADDEPLMPEQAFPASIAMVKDNKVTIQWKIADDYYMYRNKFRFLESDEAIDLGEADLPPGKIKQDEFFGEVETYRGLLLVDVPYQINGDAPASFVLTAVSQGCADMGICYPPHKQDLTVTIPATRVAALTTPDPVTIISRLGDTLGITQTDDEFLEPDQAFQLLTTIEDNTIQLTFTAAENYYLYKNKIKVSLADPADNITLGKLQLPDGKTRHDEYFGNVEVYYGTARAHLPVANHHTQTRAIKLAVQYQGCADAGLCYPPINKLFDLDIPPGSKKTALTSSTANASDIEKLPTGSATLKQSTPETSIEKSANTAPTKQTGFSRALLAILSAFGVGILLTFTPCVLPMIPILSSIITGQSSDKASPLRAGMLSLVYVLGTAVTYTAVGVLAGATGDHLQAYFQNTWVLSSFAVILVALALSMFGLYEIQMPAFIQSRIQSKANVQQGGTYIGVFIMGLLSAAIVGACVSPGLIAVLGIAMQSQDPILGGAIMFSMALGMGIVLIAIGFGLGTAPKAGTWMDTVKYVSGVLLLAVAIYLLSLIPDVPILYLWAALFIITGIYMKAAQPLPESSTGRDYLWKGIGMFLLIWGSFALLGAFMGNRDILKPVELNQIGSHSSAPVTGTTVVSHDDLFIKVNTIEEFSIQQQAAVEQGKPLLVDFYADWCTDCLRMEKETFSNPEVQQILHNEFVSVQIDVTDNNDTDRAIKKHLGVFGPPAILIFAADGQPLEALNFYGYKKADEFLIHIRQALKPS